MHESTQEQLRAPQAQAKGSGSRQFLAIALIVFGSLILLGQFSSPDWVFMALLSLLFFVGYRSRDNYGLLVTSGVFAALSLGNYFDSGTAYLAGFSLASFLVDRLEPKPNRWAYYSGLIFAALAALNALSAYNLLSTSFLGIGLVILGVWLLLDERGDRAAVLRSYLPSAQASQQAVPEKAQPTVQKTVREAVQETSAAVPTPAATRKSPQTLTPESEPPTDAVQGLEPLYTRLERWRSAQATQEGLSVQDVLSDEALAQIASERPTTLGGLESVAAVGTVKAARYGQSLLQLLTARS